MSGTSRNDIDIFFKGRKKNRSTYFFSKDGLAMISKTGSSENQRRFFDFRTKTKDEITAYFNELKEEIQQIQEKFDESVRALLDAQERGASVAEQIVLNRECERLDSELFEKTWAEKMMRPPYETIERRQLDFSNVHDVHKVPDVILFRGRRAPIDYDLIYENASDLIEIAGSAAGASALASQASAMTDISMITTPATGSVLVPATILTMERLRAVLKKTGTGTGTSTGIPQTTETSFVAAAAASADRTSERRELGQDPIEFYYKLDNPYKPLTTYFPSPIELDGKVWPTVEHYFQAQKFPGDAIYQEAIRTASKPESAKQLGTTKDRPVRPDWELYRETVMRNALRAKFEQNPPLKELLLSTGDRTLVDVNPIDLYWGVGKTRKGQNRLGELLMEVRTYLKTKSSDTGTQALAQISTTGVSAVRSRIKPVARL